MSRWLNEGVLDRVLRVVAGAVLLYLAFIIGAGVLETLLMVGGVLLVVTAVVGFCPAYALLGIRTCGPKQA